DGLAPLPDRPYARERARVCEWIAVDQDEVRTGSHGHGSNFVLHAKHLCRLNRRHAHQIQRLRSGLQQSLELERYVAGGMHWTTRIRPDSQADPGRDGARQARLALGPGRAGLLSHVVRDGPEVTAHHSRQNRTGWDHVPAALEQQVDAALVDAIAMLNDVDARLERIDDS